MLTARATYALVRNKEEEATANLITAITRSALHDSRHRWTDMGFLSRCIIFTYSYSESSVDAILDSYSEHPYESKGKPRKIKLKIPKRSVDINLSKEFADWLTPIAKDIGKQYESYGIRAKISLRCLLKCLAYRARIPPFYINMYKVTLSYVFRYP